MIDRLGSGGYSLISMSSMILLASNRSECLMYKAAAFSNAVSISIALVLCVASVLVGGGGLLLAC